MIIYLKDIYKNQIYLASRKSFLNQGFDYASKLKVH